MPGTLPKDVDASHLFLIVPILAPILLLAALQLLNIPFLSSESTWTHRQGTWTSPLLIKCGRSLGGWEGERDVFRGRQPQVFSTVASQVWWSYSSSLSTEASLLIAGQGGSKGRAAWVNRWTQSGAPTSAPRQLPPCCHEVSSSGTSAKKLLLWLHLKWVTPGFAHNQL